MFERVTIRAADRAASEAFYGTVLRTLGIEQSRSDARDARWDTLIVREADDLAPATRGLHIAFAAPSRARVDEFWRTGLAAGYRDDGRPGLRPQYGPDYYGGFLLDPDGNSAEAVHGTGVLETGIVDHLWIRVADVAAARRFHEIAARHAGFSFVEEISGPPRRARFAARGGSFSLVAGDTVTEHVHMAFPVGSDAAVEAFHRAATAAGGRDLESPAEHVTGDGERAFAASVLDLDGNHVEVVHHGPRE